MIRETLIILLALYATTSSATRVADCSTGRAYADENQVKISGCEAPPCVLRRKSKIRVEQHFTPKKDVETLTTSVYAQIFGLPVPFFGVNGSDACDLIFNPDGTKATCPLNKGQEYVYKNSFPILEAYPRISLVVHWALSEKSDDIACFEVPSKITS